MKKIKKSSDEPIICIPSYKRAGMSKVIDMIDEKWLKRTHFVINESDHEDYLKAYPDHNLHVVSDDVCNVGLKRQACVEFAREQGTDKLVMFDDLIQLYRKRCEFHKNGDPRLSSGDTRFIWCVEGEFQRFMDDMSEYLDKYAQVGLSPREGNNRRLGFGKEISKVYGAQGIRIDVLEDEGISFTGMMELDKQAIFYEDYFVVLSLFKAGYANYFFHDWAFNQSAHNCKGGNSDQRNLENHEHSVKMLQKVAGEDYMQIHQHTGNRQWKDMKDRWEIKRMFWRRLYDDSCDKLNNKTKKLDFLFK